MRNQIESVGFQDISLDLLCSLVREQLFGLCWALKLHQLPSEPLLQQIKTEELKLLGWLHTGVADIM